MKLDFFLSRTRYLALALPLFALSSTLHAGCAAAPNGFYYTGYGGMRNNRTPSVDGVTVEESAACVVFRAGYAGYAGYYAPCEGDEGSSAHEGSGANASGASASGASDDGEDRDAGEGGDGGDGGEAP